MIPERKVVICRAAREGLPPGAVKGHNCNVCKEPLGITPGGIAEIRGASEVLLLCNECALLYVHLADGAGKELEYRMSPFAQAQLECKENNSPLVGYLRKHAK